MDEESAIRSAPSGTGHKRARLFLLRGTICVAVGGLMLSDGLGSAGLGALALLLAFAWSNLFLVFLPSRLLRAMRFEMILGGLDLILVVLGMTMTAAGRSALPVSFLLMILVVALGDDRLRAVGGTTAVVAMHAWFFLNGPPEGRGPQQLTLQIIFLGAVGLYYGYLVQAIYKVRKKAEIEKLTHRELSALLEILETITSSLDVREVCAEITTNINAVVPSLRCSLLRIDPASSRCQVLSSHDEPDLDGLEVDLSLYPEIREAIRTRMPVLVSDVASDPLMVLVADKVRRCGIDTIHVAPIVFRDERFGILLLKTTRAGEGFTPAETRFCETMARASANALMHAILHRRLMDESRRHRRTSEELDRILINCPDPIISTDLQGRVSEINPAAREMLGYSKEEVWGKPAAVLFEPGWEDGPLRRLRLEGGLPASEMVLLEKGGGVIYVHMTAALLRSDGGEPSGTIWMGRDITELKNATRRLSQAERRDAAVPAGAVGPVAAMPSTAPVSTPPAASSRRILLVDDEPTILELLEIVLGEAGYIVDTAGDGEEALVKIGACEYDLVVTDVRMPRVDGIELYKRLGELNPELAAKTIFISGDLGDKETVRFLDEMKATVFAKPVEVLKLLESVDRAIGDPKSPVAA